MKNIRTKKGGFASWHPDFRMADELPDIKAVRTDFLVNLAAIAIAGILFLTLVYREFESMSLRDNLGSMQSEITAMEEEHDEAVDLNQRFMQRKKLYDDIAKFYDEPIDPIRFFYDIAAIRPEEIAFEQISYNEDQVTRKVDKKDQISRIYRMTFAGQTKNPRAVEDLKTALGELPYLEHTELTINEGASTRNPATGTIGFSIRVTFSSTQ